MKRFHFITGVLILIFSIFFTSNSSYSQAFQIFNTNIEGMANGSVSWVDVNNDGYLDIFICGRSKTDMPVSKLYLNSNGTEFIPSSIVFTPVTFGSSAWGDYDNDGDLDLLLTGYTSDKQHAPVSKIYRNDLPGGFTDISAPLTKVYKGSSAWGDYDNDGDLDCIISGLNSNNISVTKVYRNDNNNIFNETNIHIAPVYESTLTFCDIDNDKDNDLIVTGLNTRFQSNFQIVTRIYKNYNGDFTVLNLGLTPVYNGSVSCGDYNSDGYADILLTGSTEIGNNPFSITKIYKNESAGGMVFTDINANLPGIHSSVGLWGDYDNDGDLDVLLSGSEQSGGIPLHISTIYKNNNSSFEPTYNVLVDSLYNCSGAWGDYDNDSDLDIILAGSDINHNEFTRIYNNQTDIVNNLPVEPDGLTTTVDVNNELNCISLMWLPSTDYETPQKGLTYNLRVGTTHEGNEIMSPNSNPRNGFCNFPSIGNVGHNRS
jgi:predicted nucleotidyltransferase